MSTGHDTRLSELSETYHRRRTVRPGSVYEAPVRAIGWRDTDALGVTLDIAGESMQVVVPANADWRADNAVADLIRELALSPETNPIADVPGQTLHVQFDGNMSSVTLPETNATYPLAPPVTLADESPAPVPQVSDILLTEHGFEIAVPDENTVSFTDLNRTLALTARYADTESLWTCSIADVVPHSSGDKFSLVVDTNTEYPLEWVCDLPHTADPEANAVTEVIEQLGGGEIEFLEGTEVAVFPTGEYDDEDASVGTDTAGAFELGLIEAVERIRDQHSDEQDTESDRYVAIRSLDARYKKNALYCTFAGIGMLSLHERSVEFFTQFLLSPSVLPSGVQLVATSAISAALWLSIILLLGSGLVNTALWLSR